MTEPIEVRLARIDLAAASEKLAYYNVILLEWQKVHKADTSNTERGEGYSVTKIQLNEANHDVAQADFDVQRCRAKLNNLLAQQSKGG